MRIVDKADYFIWGNIRNFFQNLFLPGDNPGKLAKLENQSFGVDVKITNRLNSDLTGCRAFKPSRARRCPRPI
jgi:hypothetical protein